MLTRREFAAATAGILAAPSSSLAAPVPSGTVLYTSVGRELFWYAASADLGTLVRRGSAMLPSNVQYAWPHPSRRFLYVVSSSGSPGVAGENHFATAWRIDPASGALEQHGTAKPLPYRPIHISVDGTGRFALLSYIEPSHVTVFRIEDDGRLGSEVLQAADLDVGIYAHQLRTTPSNRTAILATRGYNASATMPERPGALKVMAFNDGVLTKLQSIAPNGGYGFGPRHLDFHPTMPFVYVSLERQNKLHVFRLKPDNTLDPRPAFIKDTLDDPKSALPGQQSGTIHVHPNGRFVYVANRNSETREEGGKQIFAGGVNSIAVFAIDQKNGEPMLIQNAPSRGIQPRTFSLDPSGMMLVAANIMPLAVHDSDTIRILSAGLTAFRVNNDGKLNVLRSYDIDTGKDQLFWSGMLSLG